jgi:hypothetical protein
MEISNKLTGQQLSLWTSSAEDILVNLLAPQASEKEQTTLDTCGLGLEQPLASYNLSTQSWRMSEDISLWGDYKLLESLPKSGMTRNGVLYQQLEWERPIKENALSSWPTPTARDGKGASGHKKLARRLADLTIQARLRDGVNTGSLNPEWVEWLMGFPSGWTNLED